MIVALFGRDMSKDLFYRSAEHLHDHLSALEYQSFYPFFTRINLFDLPSPRHNVPMLSSLTLTRHRHNRLYGVFRG